MTIARLRALRRAREREYAACVAEIERYAAELKEQFPPWYVRLFRLFR